VLNAADEVAVEAFLKTEIAFQDISRINAAVLERRSGRDGDVDALLEADRTARERAREEVRTLTAAGRSTAS
jgi:1-deoxy-D-xylulose-5-phosphate reductoisomerase